MALVTTSQSGGVSTLSRTRHVALYCVPIVIALAFVAAPRCWRLGDQFLSGDEAFTWRVIGYPLSDMLGRVADDVHGPGHYLLLKAWVETWGALEFAWRFPSRF